MAYCKPFLQNGFITLFSGKNLVEEMYFSALILFLPGLNYYTSPLSWKIIFPLQLFFLNVMS
jgi:hypothetical protein